MARQNARFQFRVSTISLLAAVVALAISLFLLTARHNAQLWEMTQRHNAQLAAQAAEFKVQLDGMELRRSQESDRLQLPTKPLDRNEGGGAPEL